MAPAELAITVDYPQWLRVGDRELVRVRIDPAMSSPQGETSDIAGGGADPRSRSRNQEVEIRAIQARLEINGAVVSPEGDTTSPWSAHEPAVFTWTIRAAQEESARGTAWTFLVPVSSSDLAAERIALSAQPVKIAASAPLGVNGPAARLFGSILMVLGTILGLPGLDRTLTRAIPPRGQLRR